MKNTNEMNEFVNRNSLVEGQSKETLNFQLSTFNSRLSTLVLIVFCLFFSATVWGQSTTLTVYGDNTTTNEYVPIYGWYCDEKSKVEFIIPADKLSDMNGGSVSAMKFYLASSNSSNNISATFNVFVKEVNATTLTGFTGTTNATIVYSSTISIATNQSNIELNIPFSPNYVYGGGNLLVGVYQTGNTSYNHTYWTGENQSENTAWQAYGSGSGSGRTFLPKTTFTYTIPTTPTVILSPSSATVLTGFTQTLTASTYNVTGTPSISYTSSNTNVATVSGTGTSATVTAVAPGSATITATMTYQGNNYTATCAITVEDPSYCEPNPSSRDGQGITALTFGSGDYVVNNSNSSGLPASSPYYGDYTSMVGGYEPGEIANVSITYTTGYNYGTLIWVDWNKNYTFEDSEIVFQGQSSSDSYPEGAHTLTATFTVPSNQAGGDYRMRVAGADSYFDSYIEGSASANHDPCFTSSYAVCHDYTLRVVSDACLAPTNVTVTNVTEHSVSLEWTPRGIATQWIIVWDREEYASTHPAWRNYITTTATSYTITDYDEVTDIEHTGSLTPGTEYRFRVFSDCEGLPNAPDVNATTESACPKPTNVTVSNLAPSRATVSWESNAGNYTVRYSTATITGTTLDPVFEDGFENGLGSWTIYAMGYDDPDYNWIQYDGTIVDEGNHTGDYVAASRSWLSSNGDQSVDNWLVTPQMTLGDVVKFWVACNDGYRDSYAVYVSTGSNVVTSSSSIGDFVLVKSYAEATGTWTEIPVDISAYAGQQGYVAIRHTNYGGDHILVDDFGVYNTINTYSYEGWTTVSPNPTTESCQITGLSAETLYAVQVQANCGGSDGSSAWSTIYFTTPDNCGAPQELASSNITSTTAALAWADDKESYNLRYRKVYYYEDFESSDGIPAGWTTINNSSTAGSLNWQVMHMTNHSGNNSLGSGSYIYQNSGITPDNWLISPQLDLQGTLRVWLSGYPSAGDRYSEHFAIYISTSGNSVSNFTTTLVSETTTTDSYVEYTADLSSYAGQSGYIAIRHFNCSDQNYLCVDDFGLYGSENWVTLSPNPTAETANLTGLTPDSDYEWQVRGVYADCAGGYSRWSNVANFTTLKQYTVSLSANPTAGGTVDGAGTYDESTDVALTATPATGYCFKNWTEGGSEVSTSASYTISSIADNHTLVANFVQNLAVNSLSNIDECISGTDYVDATPTAGSGNYTYTWQMYNGSSWVAAPDASSSDRYTPPYTTTGTVSYRVSVADNNGCAGHNSVVKEFSVKVSDVPSIALSASPVCSGSTLTLEPSVENNGKDVSSSSYHISANNSDWSSFTNGSPVTNEQNGYYIKYTATNGCGSSSQTVQITVNSLPTASIDGPTSVCALKSETIVASGAGDGGSYSWSNDLGSGASKTVAITSNANYTVTVTDANGCKDEETISMTVTVPGNQPMTHAPEHGIIWTGYESEEWDNIANWIYFDGSYRTLEGLSDTLNLILRTGDSDKCILNNPVINSPSFASNSGMIVRRPITIGEGTALNIDGDLKVESGSITLSSTGALLVTGNANIASGASVAFDNKDTLSIAGNLVLEGTLDFPESDTTPALRLGGNLVIDGGSIEEGGTLVFAGSSTQNVSNGASPLTLNNNVRMNMHRSRAGVPHTVFPDGTIFSKTTIFEYGIMDGNITFNATGRTIVCGGYESYASGTVTKIGAGVNFTFPTGDDNVLGSITAKVALEQNAVAKFHHKATGFTIEDGYPRWWNVADMCGADPFNHVSNFEYWDFNSSAAISGVMFRTAAATAGEHFHSPSEYPDPDNPDNIIQVAVYDECWKNGGGELSITPDFTEITISNVAVAARGTRGGAITTLGSKSKSVVLPIELTSFTATCDGRSTLVEWSTATERNNDYFSLERSDDAINFVEIARIAGAGNSIEPLNYSYTDYGIHGGDNYYRLVQVDYDGTRTVSEIVVANCVESATDGEPEVLAYPNPFSSELTVVLDNFDNRTATIEVYDMLGKLIYTEKASAPQNSYETILNFSSLPSGAYTVRVSTTDFVINKNVVKN